MNDSSTSGAITSAFENISTVFTAHSEITSGGFNCLYKAQRYGKWYVLKGLKPEFRNSAVHQELLAKEFELGIKMNHPHIAQTVGLDTDPLAGPCIVMEYVDGVTLKEFLQTNPSAKTRLKIAHELLSAMAYFHGLQIVHRDLKPDNILITRNGHNVKLIDFGLADSDYHGVLKQPAGSDRYAAPEQKEGKVSIDCRADIYAFGKILRQLFPHRYGAICRKCVQPDRNKRYNNAEEILKQLKISHLWFSVILLTIIVILLTLTGIWGLRRTASSESAVPPPTPTTPEDTTPIPPHHDTLVMQIPSPAPPVTIPKEAITMMHKQNVASLKPCWQCYHRAQNIDDIKNCEDLLKQISINFISLRDSLQNSVKKAYPQCKSLPEQLNKLWTDDYVTQLKAVTDSINRKHYLLLGLPDPFE